MYIEGKYWNNLIGDSDDSLTLMTYLADKQSEDIPLSEVFSDIGLDKLNGDFRSHDEPLTTVLKNADFEDDEPYIEFYYAISVITDLAALLLECMKTGAVDLCELSGEDIEGPVTKVCITATQEEHQIMNDALKAFVANPLDYDLSDMCPEDEMKEMAALCENLRQELYG